MIVTYEKNNVDTISDYDGRNPYEIIESLHRHNVREQMVVEFKKLCGNDPSDNTIGWVLEEIRKKHFSSKISNIKFPGGKLSNYNTIYKK